MNIEREHFEAWLFSQPDDRQFNYMQGSSADKHGCLFVNYLRDSGYQEFRVFQGYLEICNRRDGGAGSTLGNKSFDWIFKLAFPFTGFVPALNQTAWFYKAKYKQMFGDPLAPVLPVPAPAVEVPSIRQQTVASPEPVLV